LESWLRNLQKQNDYCDRNLNAIKGLLSHFFRFLVDEGYLTANPLDKIKFDRRRNQTRQQVVLSKNEVLQLLAAMKDHCPNQVYPFIFCIVHTGARRDEVRCLKWTDIDFETGMLHFRNTKNGDDRPLRMDEHLIALLKSLSRTNEYVFLNKRGTQLSAYQIDYTIETLQKKYPEMKRWRCHDLRHSFAYNYLKASGQMYQLQAILGHRSIQMTVNYYGHFKASDVDRVSPYWK
jgi:integrase/recombinase XerD